MKLYYHPVSTVSRPVMLFAADSGINLDYEVVDLMTGEHHEAGVRGDQPEPARARARGRRLPADRELGDPQVPRRQGRLARPIPKDLQKRARVNEAMDWFNTGFYRDFGYGLVYPQMFPHHKRRSDERTQGGPSTGARRRRKAWLGILDRHILGSATTYLVRRRDHDRRLLRRRRSCSLGELIGCDFAALSRTSTRWMAHRCRRGRTGPRSTRLHRHRRPHSRASSSRR